MDVTIWVCSYGSDYWYEKSLETANNTRDTFDVRVERYHIKNGTSIADSRNRGLAYTTTEYIIFLDADDWLEPNYVVEISKSNADVIVPAVRYHRNRVAGPAHIPKVSGCPCEGFCGPDCLDRGNYVVIGAAARTEALRAVGGFREWPMYEDWDLWLRVAKAGYSFENMPTAIYNANWSETSRNRAPTQAQRLEAHRAIAIDNGVWVP